MGDYTRIIAGGDSHEVGTEGRGKSMKRIIVGLSGASGVIYGIRLLEVMQALPDVESHLVMSTAATTNIPL